MYTTLCRSLLARSSRSIISHLSPAARRHGCGGPRGSTVLVGGSANGALSRGYCWSDWSCDEYGIDYHDSYPGDEAAAEVAGTASSGHGYASYVHPNPWRRPHLYVIVDDWRRGFSLHKIDLLDGTDLVSRPHANQTPYRRLPAPGMRLQFSNFGTSATFAAVGSKIVACSDGQDGLAVIYDTDTGGQAIVHCCPNVFHHDSHWQAAMGVGNTLYALRCSLSHHGTGALHFLDGESDLVTADDNKLVWSTCSSPLPFKLESDYSSIKSYAVHPGGKTIFFSVLGDSDLPGGTYSYDTESSQWTHRGSWMLPFSGQGQYDDELDASIGHDEDYRMAKIGCCDIPSLGAGESILPPNWKRCDDNLLSGSVWLDAKLVSVGGGWFCLLESGPREGVDISRCEGDGDKWDLRVSTFRAKYGKNGELRIVDRRLARYYVLSRYAVEGFKLKAFWM